jgi:hypothetical protein
VSIVFRREYVEQSASSGKSIGVVFFGILSANTTRIGFKVKLASRSFTYSFYLSEFPPI